MPAPTLHFKPRHLVTLLVCALSPLAASAAEPFTITKSWTFQHGGSGKASTAEIPAYDSSTNSLWIAGINGVDVLNASNGRLIQHIDTSAWGGINSVAIHNGIAAFAIESSVRTDPGLVKLFDTSTLALASGTNSFTVGALPDMLTFTPNGSKLLVANEASPTSYTGFDPAGSVSIIDMNTRSIVATVGFSGVPIIGTVRASNAGTAAMDFEPEYIAVNAAGTQAYVTLQEANAMGVLDLNSNTFTSVVGLGTKSFNTAANAIDTNDKKNVGSLKAVNVNGLYQPDSIAAYQANGQTYLVMANEGDTREDDGDKARASTLGATGDLDRLNISTTDSTASNLVTFGARSFSIRDAAGNIVFDSGNQLDAEAVSRKIYNDDRSDDKGVEPEGVAIKEINGKTYAFIGLERSTKSAVAVYDITDPANSKFIDMIVNEGTEAGNFAPEGLTVFEKDGISYLAIASEADVSKGIAGITTLYALAPVPEASSWMMLLGGLGLLGFMRRRAA